MTTTWWKGSFFNLQEFRAFFIFFQRSESEKFKLLKFCKARTWGLLLFFLTAQQVMSFHPRKLRLTLHFPHDKTSDCMVLKRHTHHTPQCTKCLRMSCTPQHQLWNVKKCLKMSSDLTLCPIIRKEFPKWPTDCSTHVLIFSSEWRNRKIAWRIDINFSPTIHEVINSLKPNSWIISMLHTTRKKVS